MRSRRLLPRQYKKYFAAYVTNLGKLKNQALHEDGGFFCQMQRAEVQHCDRQQHVVLQMHDPMDQMPAAHPLRERVNKEKADEGSG